jgi:hypothetical protein
MSIPNSIHDPEKAPAENITTIRIASDFGDVNQEGFIPEKAISRSYWGILGEWSRKLEDFGVEARGIQPVPLEDRKPQSYWGLSMIWYGTT